MMITDIDNDQLNSVQWLKLQVAIVSFGFQITEDYSDLQGVSKKCTLF